MSDITNSNYTPYYGLQPLPSYAPTDVNHSYDTYYTMGNHPYAQQRNFYDSNDMQDRAFIGQQTMDGTQGYIAPPLKEMTIYPSANDYRALALLRSRNATSPTINFSGAQDLNWIQQMYDNMFGGSTCLNTLTSFYGQPRYAKRVGPTNRITDFKVAGNPKFVNNPERYGYKEISQSEALPGDMIILSDQYNHPHHATMYDSVATSPGVDAYGNTINVGDTLVNYSNGSSTLGRGYKKGVPLSVFDGSDAGGDFTGKHTYIRFTGEKK